MISFLLAMDENRLIGKDNDLPWHLPADLKYFKKMTMNKSIVMGRKTFESIGKPLPGRESYVITRRDLTIDNVTILHSIDQFLEMVEEDNEKEWFVIGGAEIYRQLLPYADRLYITEIHEEFQGDAYFAELKEEDWVEKSRDQHTKDDKNSYDYDFVVYERV
ncbi:dihydrofolate reductase [Alkalihalobacillus algicola]|nr:dihydrofolate reductase [Alkalihalobacillus algicola]MCA0988233.1 dihydrofolate reductase [Alkalihalobacillus algicola]